MRSDAGNSGKGYIYEMGGLIETESLSAMEKEEFSELTEFVKSKLNNSAIGSADIDRKSVELKTSKK